LHAEQALSQLSYGPRSAQCSREFEILCPVDEQALVVTSWTKAKLNLLAVRKSFDLEEIAPIQLGAVRCKSIDFRVKIAPPNKSVTIPPTAVAANDHDISVTRRPFALDPHQPAGNIEDEVVPFPVRDCAIDADAEFDRC
jgi:hypothetical protein